MNRLVMVCAACALAVSAVLASGCGDDAPPAPVERSEAVVTAGERREARYGQADTRIQVPVGERFAIVLPTARTSGYQWRVRTAPNPAILTTRGREYRAPTGARTTGSDISRFAGRATGRTTLVMDYLAPGSQQPVRSVTFTIRVG